MKTLRAKLFVNIASIFLLAAILNIVFSAVWIKRDLTKAGDHINEKFEGFAEHIKKFVSFLITYHIVEEGTELGRIVQISDNSPIVSSNMDSLWRKAANIVTYNPDISFVQIQDSQGKSVSILPSQAFLSAFSWALDKQDNLWIRVKDRLFQAFPYRNNFLLFSPRIPAPLDLHFSSIEQPKTSYHLGDSASYIFHNMLLKKNEWVQKMEFIVDLLPFQEIREPPLGIAKVNFSENSGALLLSSHLFSKEILVPYEVDQESSTTPALVFRETPLGGEIDMVKSISFSYPSEGIISVGFSLSAILEELCLLLKKPIIASSSKFSVILTPSSEVIDLKNSLLINALRERKTVTWNNESYEVSHIELRVLDLFLLTPSKTAHSVSLFLETLGQALTEKISLTLIGASFLSFAVAIFLLGNLSKKITNPIAILSKAAESLGSGHYNDLTLPSVDHRQDEVATFVRSFEAMVQALKRKDKIQGLLNKVVSKEISEKILEQNIELGGEEKIVTLLFSDIRNFTHISETLQPHTVIEILNDYMTRMCKIIDATHGVVDKFIGDAIMTLYGAPITLKSHALNAIEAALRMKEDLTQWNLEREKAGQVVFEIGIGIHTGLVCTGNMGAENRLNYTAIGSNVNQASRICSVAKPMQILISEDTLKATDIESYFSIKKLAPVTLKGIQNPVQIYEVIGRKQSVSIN